MGGLWHRCTTRAMSMELQLLAFSMTAQQIGQRVNDRKLSLTNLCECLVIKHKDTRRIRTRCGEMNSSRCRQERHSYQDTPTLVTPSTRCRIWMVDCTLVARRPVPGPVGLWRERSTVQISLQINLQICTEHTIHSGHIR